MTFGAILEWSTTWATPLPYCLTSLHSCSIPWRRTCKRRPSTRRRPSWKVDFWRPGWRRSATTSVALSSNATDSTSRRHFCVPSKSEILPPVSAQLEWWVAYLSYLTSVAPSLMFASRGRKYSWSIDLHKGSICVLTTEIVVVYILRSLWCWLAFATRVPTPQLILLIILVAIFIPCHRPRQALLFGYLLDVMFFSICGQLNIEFTVKPELPILRVLKPGEAFWKGPVTLS